jgi:serine/threonine protein kinase
MGDEPTSLPDDGPTLGRYTLIRKIATGGMAEVFLARQQGPQRFNKTVVVKRLLPHLSTNPEHVRMFLNEARIAALLSHPNVISVFDVGSDEDACEHYMAMEFLDGCNLAHLRRVVAKKGGAPPQIWARIISEACVGLHYVHELVDEDGRPLNVVHRDVSLDNIVVTRGGQVKIVDFGIAKAETIESSTKAGQLKGKFSYMAPEIFLGTTPDRTIDVWAMGVTLYVLLTGTQPFRRKGAAPADTMHRVIHVEPKPVTSVAPACPAQLARIIHKCLAKSPRDRYRSAAALQSELDRWIAKSELDVGRSELTEFVRDNLPRSTLPEGSSSDELAAASAEAAFGGEEDFDLGTMPMDSVTRAAAGEAPNIRPTALRRLTSYMIELALAALVFRYTFDSACWAPFAALFGVTVPTFLARRGTFGQALLGLEVMPLEFSASPWERGILRFFLQHGWLLLFGFFVSAAYESSRATETLGMLAIISALLSWLGSIGVLTRGGQGLHDRLSGVRVIRRPRS